jgi:DNA invertase Pin-like site-specific DNA recombinase
MLHIRKRRENEWWRSRRPRAAIYLCESGTLDQDESPDGLSIDYQRARCRCTAAAMHAEIAGEFIERRPSPVWRPALDQLLSSAAGGRRFNHLIVFSLDRLADDIDEAFETAWYISSAGVEVIPANWRDYHPTPPSH